MVSYLKCIDHKGAPLLCLRSVLTGPSIVGAMACPRPGSTFYTYKENIVTETNLPGDAVQKQQIAQIRPPRYDFAAFESKWRDRWEQQKLYEVHLHNASRPYYNLMMFPYPSAEGLHVANMYSYI